MLKSSASFIRKLSFQKDGQPRSWLKFALLKDQKSGQPRKFLSRLIFKKNGSVRQIYSDWYLRYLQSGDSSKFAPYLSFIRGQIAKGKLGEARTLHIVSTLHTEIVAEVFIECLSGSRLSMTRSLEMPSEFSHDIYLIIAPQMFDRMPPPERTIIMQMEQINASNWATPEYLERISKSLGILDYSCDNINALGDRGIPSRQMFYVPLIPYKKEGPQPQDRDIDVLFYGAISSSRRKQYIKALSEHMKIRVESDLFGDHLREILRRTKVVVNIHFYENALLETTRILQATHHGARVVSESAQDQEDYATLSPLVSFVPSGDIDALVGEVERCVREEITTPAPMFINDFRGTKYHIVRAFNALGVLSYNEVISNLNDFTLPSDRLVLALPEQRDRYRHASSNLLSGAELFHGLRHIDGWKGCANSYRLLATLALRERRDRILVYEDDAEIPANIVERLAVIERYLLQERRNWDVFSGLISDVDANVSIEEVGLLGSETFIHTRAFVGLVFCIYRRRVLEWMSEFEFKGEDIHKHTIDRFLESKDPRCVTTLRPLVGHAEEFASSIWNNKNSHSSSMIRESSRRLEEAHRRFVMRERDSSPQSQESG